MMNAQPWSHSDRDNMISNKAGETGSMMNGPPKSNTGLHLKSPDGLIEMTHKYYDDTALPKLISLFEITYIIMPINSSWHAMYD
ncbi:hypothetical protein L1987_26867 [Smallanthus sonchifolius]|uniref:Uncharacterized protein n=1 Tax=Smallanthus sonchifolius TaxID=185202 RepID=A0ACB9I9M9_9ASTR|nr:hypothetical protein L1987_26867 [Smallanthus sonchifolius]